MRVRAVQRCNSQFVGGAGARRAPTGSTGGCKLVGGRVVDLMGRQRYGSSPAAASPPAAAAFFFFLFT